MGISTPSQKTTVHIDKSWCVSSLLCDLSWHPFHPCVYRTECAREWGRRIKIVGCQRHTMHHDEGIIGDGDQGQIGEWNGEKQRAGQRRKTKMTGGEKRQRRIRHSISVIFKWSNSHRNRRAWVTVWLFYYVADWPQPSNIWTCMCGSFLSTVLLVTFSFLSLSRINTLYLDTAPFVFASYKKLFVFRRE